MPKFTYLVTIECEDQDDAEHVIGERLGFDESYGFDYSLDFEHATGGDADIRGSLQMAPTVEASDSSKLLDACKAAGRAFDALANECTPMNPGLSDVFNRVCEETGVSGILAEALADAEHHAR